MNRLLFVFALATAPLFAEVSMPTLSWVENSSGSTLGRAYSAERIDTKKGVRMQVEIRPLGCEPIAVSNPKCSFDFAEFRNSTTTVKATSQYNGLHCKLESFTDLLIVDGKLRAFDDVKDFQKKAASVKSHRVKIGEETLRLGTGNVLDPSCVTWDGSLK
jgi:hypothetical protein